MLASYKTKGKLMFKRVKAFFIALIFSSLIGFNAFPPNVNAVGEIEINTCDELAQIGINNAYPLNEDYILGNDIDCSLTNPGTPGFNNVGIWGDGYGFEPIGTYYSNQGSPTSFTGTFDGQNFTISGLFIDRPNQSNIGLFGVIDDGATVENFTLSNADITGDWYVGAVAGGLVGHLENVHASGTVNGYRTSGGLVGQHVPIGNLDNSSPLVYTWNGSKYIYTDDVGGQLPRYTNAEDLAQIDKSALAPKDGKYSMKIAQEYNEIVYYDQLSLMTFDHQPGYSVVSPLFRNTTKDDLRTISDTPTNTMQSCVDKYGNDCKDSLGSYDDKWSYKDDSKVNYWVMDFGDLSASKDENVQLVMRGARNYDETPESKLRTVQVKDQNGNWVEIYNKNDIGSDGSPRLRTIDLTGKFLSDNYQVKVGFDTLQANYFAIDTSPQVPVETNTYEPESVDLDFHGFTAIDRSHFNDHDYYDVKPYPATQFKNQYGKFTKYGDVTPLLQSKDDQYAVMRYGDQLNVEFPYNAVPEGKERSFILNNQALYKHANLGTLGTHVDPLPYQGMGTYDLNTQYPDTPENKSYLDTWNTREYVGTDNPSNSTIVDSSADVDVTVSSCNAGGVVGSNRAKDIIGTQATGNVTANCTAGGLAGELYDNSEISQSSASGNVLTSNSNAGGLVGAIYDGSINQSYATGSVEGNYYVGGLVGYMNIVSITDSYSRGDVTGNGDYTGGIVGQSQGASLERTYSTGEIVNASHNYVGGISGYHNLSNNNINVKDSFASGSVVGTISGGIIGEISLASSPFVDNVYWNLTDSDDPDMPCYNYQDGGYQLGNDNCTKIENNVNYFKSTTNGPMTEFDFDAIWSRYDSYNEGFPCLQWDLGCAENSVAFISPQTNKPIKLELSAECTFEALFKQELDGGAPNDVAYDYPNGLVGFNADCGQAGFTTTVTQTYFGVTPGEVTIRKYNPTTGAYFTIADAVLEQITIENQPATRVTYTVKDGSSRDADGLEDGLITDPAGLAVNVVGAPNTGLGKHN